MYTINFKRLYYVCDKVVVRNIRNRRINPTPIANPGLQRRVDVFQDEGLKIPDEDTEEFVEQSESDFYNVGEAYNEHLKEGHVGKHVLRHHIIKEKYFKENLPNLLTWSEKEQIRHLVTTYPDEWTPEKIATSFPVTANVAKKLLKFAWKPASEERIARHDASAMRNWRDLREGNLSIPEELREHFLKFSNRSIPPLNKESIKIDVSQEVNMGEFEKIIRKCAAQEEQKKETSDEVNFKSTNETSLTVEKQRDVIKDKKRITLDELAAKINKRLDNGDVELPDKIILNAVRARPPDMSTIEPSESKDELPNETGKEREITKYQDNEKFLTVTDYSLRIRIPKKAYKKGATYKVKDCYYDHDGKFLYRVLGMSN